LGIIVILPFRSASGGCVLLALGALDYLAQLSKCPAADRWNGALHYFHSVRLGYDCNFPRRAQRHHQKAARAGGAELGQKQGDNETVSANENFERFSPL
jgi:hypothetical protein